MNSLRGLTRIASRPWLQNGRSNRIGFVKLYSNPTSDPEKENAALRSKELLEKSHHALNDVIRRRGHSAISAIASFREYIHSLPTSGIVLNRHAALTALHVCLLHHKTEAAFEVYEAMIRHNFNLDLGAAMKVISLCTQAGEIERAVKLVYELDEKELPSVQYLYAKLLWLCSKFGTFEQTQEVFTYAQKRGVVLTCSAYAAMVHAYANNRQAILGLKYMQQGLKLAKNDEDILALYTAGVLSCKALNDGDRAFAMYQDLRNKYPKLQPSVRLINAVMGAGLATGQSERAMMMLGELNNCGIRPNESTYRLLIGHFFAQGRIDTLRSRLDEIEEKGEQSQGAYTQVFALLGEVFRVDDLFQILNRMKDHNVSRGLATYNAALEAAAVADRSDIAIRLLKMMEQDNVKPTARSLVLVLRSFTRRGDIVKAIALFREYTAEDHPNRIPPHRGLYHILLHTCSRQGAYQAALKLFEEMKGEGHPVDRVTYNTLLNVAAKSGRVQAVTDAFDLLERAGYKPDFYTYSILIDAYRRLKDVDKVFDILQKMTEDPSVAMSETVYSAPIMACAEADMLDRSFKLADMMKEAGVELTGVTLKTLITACQTCNELNRGHELIQMAEQRYGVAPDADTYTALINAYVFHEQPEGAFATLSEMRQNGHSPKLATHMALLRACSVLPVVERQKRMLQVFREAGMSATTKQAMQQLIADLQELGSSRQIAPAPTQFTPNSLDGAAPAQARQILGVIKMFSQNASLMSSTPGPGVKNDDFTSFIDACFSLGRPEADVAFEVIDLMVELNVPRHLSLYQKLCTYIDLPYKVATGGTDRLNFDAQITQADELVKEEEEDEQ
eukprot:TRINITY_DN15135_c0_g1::TRINITY_DN15135_c0_g1_i1::g.30710::m.30710 TRINITY_DN15135_c0_g1::TRINITY_DN15135_c0_g1_i1::g.30710  ORF type:complete len:858 (+),score=164.59,sp/Q9LSL9/PP445_ARATH/23.03/2e-30,sp/Q9LSL9/PP445_ARATH/21.16/2e-19,sp/Q9LSL9/PP445_ARATH/21.16/4e-12,PPR_2/PF13041.1/29,PPR_2/PF13041.1/68,PPR_2/PF13041.1/8.2,PPR_2/PF13041.1/3.4e+03,PPR_2/PF13041.1/0.00063,PPR_2/PF13041.1/6.4,PPR_2/PF13041.1/0.032,PPR_2/PF13041.1/9e+02,PPR_2/PF13041.1/8.3e-09,PPR_2/PF13041.1/6.7e-11,PPR_2/PF13041